MLEFSANSIVPAFLIIRLFAIYDKKRWVIYLTAPFGLLTVVLSGVRTFLLLPVEQVILMI